MTGTRCGPAGQLRPGVAGDRVDFDQRRQRRDIVVARQRHRTPPVGGGQQSGGAAGRDTARRVEIHDCCAAGQHGGGVDVDAEQLADIGGHAAGFFQHQNCSAVKRQSRTCRGWSGSSVNA
jgi:hypothetical protein